PLGAPCMRRYEITYDSTNSAACAKPITALVGEPDRVGPDTGVLLLTHGWGVSRFTQQGLLDAACDAYDVIGVAVEFRQSGLAFDSDRGYGWDCPYDLSFFQLFDVINGLRTVLTLRRGLNTKRLFHHGMSQGGHLALLSAIVAPDTFAAVYPTCPATFMEP